MQSENIIGIGCPPALCVTTPTRVIDQGPTSGLTSARSVENISAQGAGKSGASSHLCDNCGSTIPCDKRQKGKGRQNQPLSKYGDDHNLIHALLSMKPGEWITVYRLLEWVNEGRAQKKGYLWVQNFCSDLKGWGLIDMRPVEGEQFWEYLYLRPYVRVSEPGISWRR